MGHSTACRAERCPHSARSDLRSKHVSARGVATPDTRAARTLLSSGAADGSGAARRTCCAAHPVLCARTRSVGSAPSLSLSQAGAPMLSKVTEESRASAASTAAATAATSRSDADSRSEDVPPSLIAPSNVLRRDAWGTLTGSARVISFASGTYGLEHPRARS